MIGVLVCDQFHVVADIIKQWLWYAQVSIRLFLQFVS
jgi:hypothetical protein